MEATQPRHGWERTWYDKMFWFTLAWFLSEYHSFDYIHKLLHKRENNLNSATNHFIPNSSKSKIDKFSKITIWVKLKSKLLHCKELLKNFSKNSNTLEDCLYNQKFCTAQLLTWSCQLAILFFIRKFGNSLPLCFSISLSVALELWSLLSYDCIQ